MSVAVVVTDRRSHARLLASIFIEGRACSHRSIRKGSVVIVAIENARGAVARDEDVRPAIFVEVERGNAECIMPIGLVDVRLRGRVFKGSIAAIVVESVLRAGQAAWTAH